MVYVSTPNVLAKQSTQSLQIANFFFPFLPEKSTLCPVITLKAYEEGTSLEWDKVANLLDQATQWLWPLVQWLAGLKAVLTAAGIGTTILSAHSTRGHRRKVGITANDILKAADWSSGSVFRSFIINHLTIRLMVELFCPIQLQTTPLIRETKHSEV